MVFVSRSIYIIHKTAPGIGAGFFIGYSGFSDRKKGGPLLMDQRIMGSASDTKQFGCRAARLCGLLLGFFFLLLLVCAYAFGKKKGVGTVSRTYKPE